MRVPRGRSTALIPLVLGGGVAVFGIGFFVSEIVSGKKIIGKKRFDNSETVIVTGANSGIGLETARFLALRGARVIMACKNMNACENARREVILDSRNKHVICRECDLGSLQSIRNFAETILKEEKNIKVLVNNAGIMGCPKQVTKEGFEMQLGVNHLGHFLLTNLLLDEIKASAPSRIITVTDVAYERGRIQFEDLNSDKSYDPITAYKQSKLANVLFSKELARRLAGTGVTSNAVYPGITNTSIYRYTGYYDSFISNILLGPFTWLMTKGPTQGARTALYCALTEELETVTGAYFSNCTEQPPAAIADDVETAKRLWAVSERWTRLKA